MNEYDTLREHLRSEHEQGEWVEKLGDGQALDVHNDAHCAGNLRIHSHGSGIPPVTLTSIDLWPPPPPPAPAPAPSDDPFLTPAEIARDLRVSKMTVFRLLSTGAIPSIRVGRQFRIRQSAYLQYLNQKEN